MYMSRSIRRPFVVFAIASRPSRAIPRGPEADDESRPLDVHYRLPATRLSRDDTIPTTSPNVARASIKLSPSRGGK